MAIAKQAEVKLGSQDERGTTFRDRAMAENVKWILEQEPPGTKMMLWAHNGHVAAAPPLDAPDHMPMGGHLRELFGDRLVSCGFIFQPGSRREGKAADWFAQPHVSRQIGGGYPEATPEVWMHRIRAARDFDLLIFVDKTTPSR